MKILNQKILFVFFVSLAFCSEDKKYTFQYTFDYPEDGTEYIEKRNHETEWSFDVPGIGYVKYVSTYTSLSQYLGQEDGFYKFKSTVTNLESDNSVDNIKLKDYYLPGLFSDRFFCVVSLSCDKIVESGNNVFDLNSDCLEITNASEEGCGCIKFIE